MALSSSEKFTIIRLLGWPANTLVPNTLQYSKIISDRLTNLPEDIECEVLEFVKRIKELDVQLSGAVAQSGVKRIDDIEFFGGGQGSGGMNRSDILRAERRKIITELAAFLDIALGPGLRGGSMGCVSI